MADDRGADRPFAVPDEAMPSARFDLLYRSQAAHLNRRLRRRVGSAEEASDLVHDAFTRLLGARNPKAIREPSAFLNRVIRNLLVDRARRQSARPSHVSLELHEEEIGVRPAQGDQLELDQMRQRYQALVAALPPRTREVFLLHRVQDLAYRQIAERLDISVRTVEWHVAQAIIRIGRGLDDE